MNLPRAVPRIARAPLRGLVVISVAGLAPGAILGIVAMTYRDENEALRGRNAALEEELAEAHAELEAMRDARSHESEIARQVERDVAAIEARRKGPPPAPAHTGGAYAVTVIVGVVAATALLLLHARERLGYAPGVVALGIGAALAVVAARLGAEATDMDPDRMKEMAWVLLLLFVPFNGLFFAWYLASSFLRGRLPSFSESNGPNWTTYDEVNVGRAAWPLGVLAVVIGVTSTLACVMMM